MCGSAVAETTGGGLEGSLVGGAGIRDGGGDGRRVMSGGSFLQQAYRIQELQVEFHSRYSLIRCEYNFSISVLLEMDVDMIKRRIQKDQQQKLVQVMGILAI